MISLLFTLFFLYTQLSLQQPCSTVNNCVSCSRTVILNATTKEVFLDFTNCKSSGTIDWVCCRGTGANGDCVLDPATCNGPVSNSNNPSPTTSRTCGAFTGVVGFIVPIDTTSLLVQIHDPTLTGNNPCSPSNNTCCGGGGPPCSVADITVSLSTCLPTPILAPPTATLTAPAPVLTCLPQNITFSVASRAQVTPSLGSSQVCSSSNVYLVLHAELTNNLVAGFGGSTMCFTSTVTSESDPTFYLTSQFCLNFQLGATAPSCVNVNTGGTTKYTVDPTNTKPSLIGLVVYNCGTQCPNLKTIMWSIIPYTDLSSVPSFTAQWQFSGAAFQVNSVDTSCITNFQNCMGYPESQTACLVQGPFGGTGSNYCGSNSATPSFNCANIHNQVC